MAGADVLDAVVVGAGVVGLAVARELAMAGRHPLLLERNRACGQETSSRNSGVIHSGIYYPTGSLKARLCVEGRDLLYVYCAERGIAHRRCGKLIVAQDDQREALRQLRERGIANGVHDLEWLEAADVQRLEPAVRCAAAVLSPSTGIVDPHELMTSLLGDLEAAGGTLVVDARVERLHPVAEGIELTVRNAGRENRLVARTVVNAAGLQAVALTRCIDGYPKHAIPVDRLAKGTYFTCAGRPFRRLVYPMPSEAGLGIHATIDLDGNVRFGPDVEWVDAESYAVDPGRAPEFYRSIRAYWPQLPDGALQPGYAGIRPKLVGPGETAADFVIAGPAAHGIAGLVNLLGIESPGLTAALSIGRHLRTVTGL